MITLQTDRDGTVIRIHDDAFDREPSYRMQQISQIVSSHYKSDIRLRRMRQITMEDLIARNDRSWKIYTVAILRAGVI